MKHAGPITSRAINVSDDILYSASVKSSLTTASSASDDASIKLSRCSFCSGDRPYSLTITLLAKYSPVKAFTLASDGGILYGECSDGYVHYWLKGWFSGQLQYGAALQGHTHAVMCLANVGNYVVSGSADSSCQVWVGDPQDGQHRCFAALQSHSRPIRCVAAFLG
ncbi:OLC1v1036715C1 [Oldenlandia corymbosa var. corymbosa]|uniref:OLC1v1036715C1 n=1 Tax=Oldenlandia corymbosa var. corymbosa TaxID=529605 RepID=A0AAV1CX54_OLDCO|nr:OLC1v1036715C1 [Oldenlandia corymbosa var. corymbosa]